jgi:hypothetical protein
LIFYGLKTIFYSLLGPWQLAIEIVVGYKSKSKLDYYSVIRFAKWLMILYCRFRIVTMVLPQM